MLDLLVAVLDKEKATVETCMVALHDVLAVYDSAGGLRVFARVVGSIGNIASATLTVNDWVVVVVPSVAVSVIEYEVVVS